MGIIWLKHPVLWHSSRVPSGYDYDAMTDEQKQLIITRWHDVKFLPYFILDAQTTTVVYCRLGLRPHHCRILLRRHWMFRHLEHLRQVPRSLGNVCAIDGSIRRLNLFFCSSGKDKPSPGLTDKLTAVVRYTGARQFHFRATNWYAPPLAAIIGVSGMWIFFMGTSLFPAVPVCLTSPFISAPSRCPPLLLAE